MKTKKIIIFIVFYISVVLAILFTLFYVQDRYGLNPPRRRSESGTVMDRYVRYYNISGYPLL